MKFIAFICVALALATQCRADDPPHDHIDIDVRHNWRPINFSPSGVPSAHNVGLDTTGQAPKLISRTPGKRATFSMPIRLAVDMEKFPTFILKYQGANIATDNTYTCIWIGLGEQDAKESVFPLIDFNKLEFDGKPHEFRLDLRKAPQDSQGTPFETGKVCSLWVSVMNTADGDGSIQIDGLSFEAEDRAVPEPRNDQEVRVVVTNADDKPIKGAKVIVDAERISSAKSADTNEDGLATIAPLANETDRHVIRVEAEKMASVVLVPGALQNDPIRVQLRTAVQLSGIVRDADEKPVKDATVQIALSPPHNTDVRQDPSHLLVQTDETGKWSAGPVPDDQTGSILVTHPDFIYRDAKSESFENLKSGDYVTTLDK